MNNGIGPAIIKYAKVTYNNEPVKKWSDFLDNSNLVQSHISTRILPSQANVKAVRLKGRDYLSEVIEIEGEVLIELCYCSIYEQCWVVDRNNQPKEVAQCEIANDQRFVQ